MSVKVARALLVAALAVLATGCGGVKEDPILLLSARESLAEGKSQMEVEKYARARPYLVHAFEVEPNSAIGREGLLLAADTFYLQGGSTNLIQAEAKYRDFLNRFPTSDQAAYVQFQIANSLALRIDRPDRDLSTTEEGLAAYEELLRLYPTSEYAAQAREQIRIVRDNLAEHEFMVGRFYLRRGLPDSAVVRLEHLLEEFPDYSAKDKALFYLGNAYEKLSRWDDSAKTFARLRNQYPDSEFLKDAPDQDRLETRARESAANDNG